MTRSARMAPIRDILEELENMDETEWPEGTSSHPPTDPPTCLNGLLPLGSFWKS